MDNAANAITLAADGDTSTADAAYQSQMGATALSMPGALLGRAAPSLCLVALPARTTGLLPRLCCCLAGEYNNIEDGIAPW